MRILMIRLDKVVNFVDSLIMRWIRNKTARMMIFYFVLGGFAFSVDYLLLYILTDVFLIHYLVSAAISFSIGVTINYTLNRELNFRSKNKRLINQFIVFLSVSLIGLSLNEILLYYFVESLHLHYLLAKPFVVLMIFPISFFLHKSISFNN
jgi:putative flippase GtrA